MTSASRPTQRRRRLLAALVLPAAAVAFGAGAPAALASPSALTCKAQPLSASLLGLDVTLGLLGANQNGAACATASYSGNTGLPLGITAGALTADTVLDNPLGDVVDQVGHASASVLNLGVAPTGFAGLLSVGTASATVQVSCVAGVTVYGGSSTVANVQVAGLPVTLGSGVQSINGNGLNGLGVGVNVILTPNEVITTPTGVTRSALHVTATAPILGTILDVNVAPASVGISGTPCTPVTPPTPTVTVTTPTPTPTVTTPAPTPTPTVTVTTPAPTPTPTVTVTTPTPTTVTVTTPPPSTVTVVTPPPSTVTTPTETTKLLSSDGTPGDDSTTSSNTSTTVINTSTVSNATTTNQTATTATTTTATAEAAVFASGSESQLALRCEKSRLALTDVQLRGDEVALRGAADRSFIGKMVNITYLPTGKVIAKAKVGDDGLFAVRAAAPPKAQRTSNVARYLATSGAVKTRAFKLVRRTFITRVTKAGTGLNVSGSVRRPLAKAAQVVKIQRRTSCKTYVTVGTTKLRADGTFSAKVPLPAGVSAALLRVGTKVPTKAGGAPKNPTFSLVRSVRIR